MPQKIEPPHGFKNIKRGGGESQWALWMKVSKWLQCSRFTGEKYNEKNWFRWVGRVDMIHIYYVVTHLPYYVRGTEIRKHKLKI